MKILLHKLKKSNKLMLVSFILTTILYIVSLVLIFKNLLSLSGIETTLRIVFMVITSIWLLAYVIWNLVNIILKKKIKFIITTILTIILSVGFIYASTIVDKIYGSISNLAQKEYTLYTTDLIVMNSLDKLNDDDKLGMINNKDDVEGYVLAKELIKDKKLKNKIEYYDDYYSLLNALYKDEIKGAFVSSNYIILFSSEDTFKNIDTDTKVLYEYSKKLANKSTTSNKKLTEPFTILLMGVDSEKDGLNANAAFNGDTLILITFNPKTLTATMFSMPRDIYVPIACNNNRYNKINSAAAYGTNCVINTVKNLTGVDIDYYAKINFNGFIDLVDVLGGVDVDVEQPDYSVYVKKIGKGRLCESNQYRETDHPVCMDTGMQHLTGEQALAYARNRHGFLQSDLARNRHQQQIVEAIAKKASKIRTFDDFQKVLDAVTKNIATNMTTNQILSFYDIFKDMLANSLDKDEFVTIKKTYLETYSLPVYLQYAYMYTSALGYYPDSLKAIKELMNDNLEISKKQMVKSFSYKYKEDYTANLTGKGITTGGKLSLVPNFVGQSSSVASSWAQSNNVSLTTTGSGNIIVAQSIHEGVLVNTISSINVELGGNVVQQTTEKNEEEQKTIEEEPKQTQNTVQQETKKQPENNNESNESNDSNDSNTNSEE